jgi:hypothetical protein
MARYRWKPSRQALTIALCAPLCLTIAHASGDCLELLKRAYAKIAEIESMNRTCHVRYTVKTEAMMRGKQVNSTSEVDVVTSRSQMQVRSKEMEVFQDEAHMVVVSPSARTVFIGTSSPQKFRDERTRNFGALQERLLSTSEVSECATISNTTRNADRRITLQLRPGAQQQIRLSTITYLVDSKADMIREMIAVGLPGSDFTTVDYIFTVFESDYHTTVLDQSVLRQCFTPKGNLLAKYAGYRIIDPDNNLRR